MNRTCRHALRRGVICVASLIAISPLAHAGNPQQDRPQDRRQDRRQQRPVKRTVPQVIYTARQPAQVQVDVVTWGVHTQQIQTYRADPTRVTVTGLPRGAKARLRVQDASHAIDLSRLPQIGTPGKQQQAQQATAGARRFGALKQRVAAARNLRTVWETDNAAPEIESGEIAKTWQGAKVLPINQAYVLDWSHTAKASGYERPIFRGHVRGLPDKSERHGQTRKTMSGRYGEVYEGFIQRLNLLKTDAFTDGERTLVKVKGVRALPDGASYTIRNLQTGETVNGKANPYGSFNARVPVLANADQQLEITIQMKDPMGITTTMTRSLGRVTFAKRRQSGSAIAYHYIEPAGRKLATISANVKGETVLATRKRRTLAKPSVEVSHHLVRGANAHGSSMLYPSARMDTVLKIGHVSADTTVEVLQQVAPKDGGKPSWQSVAQTMVRNPVGGDGLHEVHINKGIVGHTPLKILVRRPGARKTHVIRASMPEPGNQPVGVSGPAGGIYKGKYPNWLRPETVVRTVAHRAPDGRAQVLVRGKRTAPATARVSIVNETTGAESQVKLMRRAFTSAVAAAPGNKLALKVQYADGTVETKHLGIVPDAIEPGYQPRTGLNFFAFTQNHITAKDVR